MGMTNSKTGNQKRANIIDPSTNDQLSFRSQKKNTVQPCDDSRSENSSPGSWEWDKLQWECGSIWFTTETRIKSCLSNHTQNKVQYRSNILKDHVWHCTLNNQVSCKLSAGKVSGEIPSFLSWLEYFYNKLSFITSEKSCAKENPSAPKKTHPLQVSQHHLGLLFSWNQTSFLYWSGQPTCQLPKELAQPKGFHNSLNSVFTNAKKNISSVSIVCNNFVHGSNPNNISALASLCLFISKVLNLPAPTCGGSWTMNCSALLPPSTKPTPEANHPAAASNKSCMIQ